MSLEVIIADDHRLFAEGLAQLLGSADIHVRGMVGTRDDLPDLIAKHPQSLLLIDLNMPGMGLPELLSHMSAKSAQSKVLIITGEKDWQLVKQLLDLGVQGVVLKEYTFEEIQHALRTVVRGEKYVSTKITEQLLQSCSSNPTLTARQLEILRFVAEGFPSKKIAARLDLHIKTVDNHRQRIMEKLGVHSAAEMIKVAKDSGLV